MYVGICVPWLIGLHGIFFDAKAQPPQFAESLTSIKFDSLKFILIFKLNLACMLSISFLTTRIFYNFLYKFLRESLKKEEAESQEEEEQEDTNNMVNQEV